MVKDILNILKLLIRNHVVKINGNYYVQTRGIPQGSSLSTVLCDIYLGAMERKYWPELLNDQSESLLLRHVDDYLLATTDRAKAQEFANTIMSGIQEFDVSAKPSKTVTNFAPKDDESEMKFQELERPMLWCGMAFYPTTLEVQ